MGGYILEDPNHLYLVQDIFSARVPPRLIRKDIQFKEMKAVLHAMRLFSG